MNFGYPPPRGLAASHRSLLRSPNAFAIHTHAAQSRPAQNRRHGRRSCLKAKPRYTPMRAGNNQRNRDEGAPVALDQSLQHCSEEKYYGVYLNCRITTSTGWPLVGGWPWNNQRLICTGTAVCGMSCDGLAGAKVQLAYSFLLVSV